MAKKQNTTELADKAVEETVATVSLDELAAQAQARPDILPKLKFGDDKLEEGAVTVRFLEAAPRQFTYESPYSNQTETALSIPVELVSSDFGHSRGNFDLVMQANAKHGLTSGVLKLWNRHDKNLSGVFARVQAANYNHKQYGKTRGFSVQEVPPPENYNE